MELPHIGDTCMVCNRTDYLPLYCSYCSKTVCVDHKNDHGSDCPLNLTKFEALDNQGPSLKHPCDFCKKITLKLELVKCVQCQGEHCLYHRHQVQHDCVKLLESKELAQKMKVEKTEKQKAALDKLKESCKSSAKPKVPSEIQTVDPKKRAMMRRIRCMKIKQSARGPPNILDENRIYLEIVFQHEPKSSLSDPTKDGKTIKIFTSPKHTVGRMIDWSADELGLKNKNHLEGASNLIFRIHDQASESVDLDSQAYFSQYLEDGTIASGDQISISYQETCGSLG